MNQRRPTGRPARHRVLTCTALLTSGVAMAQPAPPPADEGAAVLAAVTVTARQAEETLHGVPLSVTVLDRQQLDAPGVHTVSDALETIADVSRYDTGDPLYDNFKIRGMGTVGNISMDNDAVALNINGSTVPNRSFGLDLLDVERLEVLKGPQGTLMGRNSTAGAINIVTARPHDTFEAEHKTPLGNRHHYSAEGMLNVPLAAGLKARLALRQSAEDHWVENAQTGSPVSKPRQLAVRGSLLWDLGTHTDALLSIEHQRRERFFALMLMRPYGEPPQTDLTPGAYDDNRKQLTRYSLEVNHRFAGSQLTSVTAIDRDRYDAVSANDRNVMRMAYGVDAEEIMPLRVHSDVVTQDLRLSSLPGARVFWVTGINYWHSTRNFASEYPMQNSRQDKHYKTTSYAVYGETTYPLTERIDVTAGLRYTRDRKHYTAVYHMPTPVPDERRLSEGYWTGRLALAYAFSPALNTYVSLARGHRPGGVGDYAAQPDDSVPFEASTTHYAEWGWKYQSADGRAQFNAALFFADMKREQISSYDPLTYFIRYHNLDARSQGAEIEGSLALHRSLRVRAGVAYTHATARQALHGLMEGDVAKGNHLPDTPAWKATLGLDYTQPLQSFAGMTAPALKASLNFQFVGKRASDIQNNAWLSSYSVVDARLGIAGRHSELYVYANNLFDRQYEMYRYEMGGGLALGAQHAGRAFGIGYNHYF